MTMQGPDGAGARGRPALADVDFSRAPFLVIWETTQACGLACLHCRASARPDRDPGELGTDEAKRMMEDVRRFGRPLLVLTGGDPLERPDVVELVAHGAGLGLRMAMTPSGTPRMTPEVVRALADAGLSRLAVSLDGSTAGIHDRFRGVAGSFDRTVRMIRAARGLGLTTQVNTTLSRHNLDDLEELISLMETLGISLWSVFFLVPTGRARADDVASAGEFERVFHRMYDLSATAPFDIKSTAAPHYRRVILQRQVRERRGGDRTEAPAPLTAGVGFSLADGVGRARGVNDGDGFLFVSHRGDIYPSGFLPLAAGNVRRDDLVRVYRESPLFLALRDRSRLRGKCGVCEYRDVCGGSRARAYALTGDPLEAEPFCAHVPARYAALVERGEAEPVDGVLRPADVAGRRSAPGAARPERPGAAPGRRGGTRRASVISPRGGEERPASPSAAGGQTGAARGASFARMPVERARTRSTPRTMNGSSPPAPRSSPPPPGAGPDDVRAAAERIAAGEAGVRVPVPEGDDTLAALARALNVAQQRMDDDRRRLREIAARAFRAQETERARLAAELQEETAQNLASLLVRVTAARRLADPARRDAALDEVRALLSETTDAVRGLARRLVPPALNDVGLVPALQAYAASLQEGSGTPISLRCGAVHGLLPPRGELALYRVVQEALANAVRHAGASGIRVVVEGDGERVRATVADDGAGFSVAAREAAHPCLGLFGMRERAAYAGGSAVVESAPGRGTRVTVELPVADAGGEPWPSILPAPGGRGAGGGWAVDG